MRIFKALATTTACVTCIGVACGALLVLMCYPLGHADEKDTTTP